MIAMIQRYLTISVNLYFFHALNNLQLLLLSHHQIINILEILLMLLFQLSTQSLMTSSNS